MQWDSSPAAGFSEAVPWIDVPASAEHINVAVQAEDPQSVLSYYRALISARHTIPALTDGRFTRIDASAPASLRLPARRARFGRPRDGQSVREAPRSPVLPEDEAVASFAVAPLPGQYGRVIRQDRCGRRPHTE